MARGPFSQDFVAAIPANTEWALNKSRPWVDPQPQIEEALIRKARGRVFRTDRDHVERPYEEVISEGDWEEFQSQTREEDLFFEFTIEDK